MPAETMFDFTFFIKNASGRDIQHFFDVASSYSEGRNLKSLFMQAFGEGKRFGYEEGEKEGYRVGYEEGEKYGYDQGYQEGLCASDPKSSNFFKSLDEATAGAHVDQGTMTLPHDHATVTLKVDATSQTTPVLDLESPADATALHPIRSRACTAPHDTI